MTLAKMKKATVSFILTAVLVVAGATMAFAATKTSTGTEYFGGGSGWLNWSFTSNGSNGSMSSCSFGKISPSTGVSYSKQNFISGKTSALGYLTASYMGSTQFISKNVVHHRISGNTIYSAPLEG